MKLIEIALTNFKKHADARFEFCPGMNLFWGPNESGKSSIHEAIYCAFFGRQRGKPVESWGGGVCSVSLTYRTAGKTHRVERRLTEGASRMGILDGDEMTDVVTAKADIEQRLFEHLGISSQQVLDNTVSVRQSDLSGLDTSDMRAVGSEIQRVLTGTANVSASQILDVLEARRNDVKGRARPSNPREYDRTTERLRALAEELADARGSRARIRNLEEEMDDLQSRLSRSSARLENLSSLLEKHGRWAELKSRETEADGLHHSVFGTVQRLKATFADLEMAQKELESYADLVGKDEEITEHLSKIQNRREELRARLDQMDAADEPESGAGSAWTSTAPLAGAIALAAVGVILGFALNPMLFLLLIPSGLLAIIYMHVRSAGRQAEYRHVTDLVDSARKEMKQLGAEEASILSYIKCRDVDSAWAKIKAYRALVTQSRELEVTLDALLGGRKLSDWEAQEADLARELSALRRELEDDFPDYSPTTEEVESWRSELASLQNSVPVAEARLHEVHGSLDAEKRNARDLAAIEGEIEFLHSRKDELEFLYKAYGEAIGAITAVTKQVSQEYLPVLSERASECLGRITSGRYTSVNVKPQWEISVDCREKSGVQPPALSVGAVDQLCFALRVACGELLSAGRKLPVILDDPFVAFDRSRLDNVLELLASLAREAQILLLTHDPYILEWAQSLPSDIPSQIHQLPGPGSEPKLNVES